MAQMSEGVVLTFNPRGFGFIISNERSIYFHAKHVHDGFVLRRGDRVQFTLAESPKYPGKSECRNIVLVERKAVRS
jgi:cold shock CspA family protein